MVRLEPPRGDGAMEVFDRLAAARVFREEAAREGFSRSGIARAETPPRFDRFRAWIAEGRHAGMAYLERTADLRSCPEGLLPGARSVVCLAAPHRSEPLVAADGSRIARYAAGEDYHGTLRERAVRVAHRAASRIGGAFRWRVCVDSTPLAERSFAAAAGLGWIGKNGCLIDSQLGSYLLLAEIVTDLDLPPDDPAAELCGSCVRCLESCPTGAFIEPKLLDAHRCLSYWTIEHRGPLTDEVKASLGENVFGCDVCQEVCPWNGGAQHPLPSPPAGVREGEGTPLADRMFRPRPKVAFLAQRAAGGAGGQRAAQPQIPTRAEWLEMGPGQWRRRFGATALNRAGRRGIQRNAAASAGATNDRASLSALGHASNASERGLADAASWALARLAAAAPAP